MKGLKKIAEDSLDITLIGVSGGVVAILLYRLYQEPTWYNFLILLFGIQGVFWITILLQIIFQKCGWYLTLYRNPKSNTEDISNKGSYRNY